jgi:hypothetical protein
MDAPSLMVAYPVILVGVNECAKVEIVGEKHVDH